MSEKARAAAKLLVESHEARRRFEALPADLAPATPEDAYAIQDAFVAMRAEKLGGITGYKIALSSPEMQKFVGVDRPQAGCIHESTVLKTPAAVAAADYVRLIIEFEIAVQMGDDLPAADAPFTRERVARAVSAVMPALEIADDRDADYKLLPRHPLHMIADNCWNAGAVLGEPVKEWKEMNIPVARGFAAINGQVVGEGKAGDCMGHPFDAVAWIADHLAKHGRGLLRGDFVITGSIVTTKTVKAGDWVVFAVEGLGSVELRVN